MYSGDTATPAMVSCWRLPLMMAAILSPGCRPWASAKLSDSTTSSALQACGMPPRLRCSAFSSGSPLSGSDSSRPVMGSLKPANSSFTPARTRVSSCSTPGSARSRSATGSGARFRVAKTSAKRYSP